jgi:hypothetical protein
MPFSDDLNKTYASTVPAPEFRIPPGWYRVRAISAKRTTAGTGSEGLRIEFAFQDEPYCGVILHRDFWLAGKALPIARRDLEAVGFPNLTPNQIEAFRAFDKLPVVRALIVQREYQGRKRPELREFDSRTVDGKGPQNAAADRS